MKSTGVLVSLLFPLLALVPMANAQTVTGSITGTVVDPSGAVVAGSTVALTNEISKQVREFQTAANGTFVFPDLFPANYDLKVTHPGFKTYIQNAIVLGTLEKVDLHLVRLEVGDVATSVEVKAEAARVVTDSSDHATDVNLKQLEQTPIRGRNFQAFIHDLPGVIDVGTYDQRGWNQNSANINGGAQGQVLVTLDGMAAQDSGAPSLSTYQAPSTDAIAEVKLLTGNYSAEYGARNGGQYNITIKNGTSQFHGSAYYYYRHEEFNANEFFNNELGIVKPKYRYENPGGTFGGPILIPGVKFNKMRNRLFFFWSYDQLWNTQSTAINKYTMPTALERQGNFSQSVNPNGSPILIRNPSNGTNYAGNIIPTSAQNPIGAAMLNLFPLPNTTDPTGTRQYNFTDQLTNTDPRTDKILRVDYTISTKDTMFVRLLQDYQAQSGYGAILGAAGDGWGQFPHSYFIPSAGFATTYIHTFKPNLLNEATVGQNRAHQENMQTNSALYNKSLLPLTSNGTTLNLPTIFPSSANYLNLLPNVNFGLPSGFTASSSPTGIPNLPSFGFDSRWPFNGTDNLATFTDNVTWIRGSHTVKVGYYFEHDARNVSVYSVYNTAGTYFFGSDLGNPVDTGDPFSNAYTGNLYGYGQDNIKQFNRSRYKQNEFFVQDNWKATRRLTFDLGLRFQRLGALYEAPGQTQGIFEASAYSAGAQGQLLFPICNARAANGSCTSKASTNPATGAQYLYSQQGTFAPGSTGGLDGTPFSGIVQQASGSAPYFQTPGLAVSPRVGFAYDVFGNGKTAVRGGFGIFYGRAFGVDTNGATGAGIGPLATPPHFLAPIVLNTNISNLAGSSLVFTPQTTVGGPLNYKPPATYDWSFGVQQDLGKGFVLDVAYVANVAHHQFLQGSNANGSPSSTGGLTPSGIDLNAVAPLTDWTPTANNGSPGPVTKFLDPTSANGGTAGFYSNNLIRALASPFPGWGGIYQYSESGESNYNSLQVQFNKRVGERFHFGSNYTWSKTLAYSRDQWVPDKLLYNVVGVNSATGQRPQAVNVNFGYAVPGATKYWNNKFTNAVTNGWNLEAVGTFYSGTPLDITCSANGAPIGYWTGTPTGGIPFRCQQTGALFGNVTPTVASPLFYNFNPASFSLPGVRSLGIGNEQPTVTYGPGVEVVDLNIFKQFHVFGEGKILELRFQAFNVLNHFNPGNPNTALSINCSPVNGVCSNNGANTNAAFGTITNPAGGAGVLASRKGVVSLRFTF